MSNQAKQKLVLVGGGHSHAIALRLWGLNPLPEVDLILISDVEQTPYSGMLPGHVAGFYSYAQTHIDLQNLAQFAGAELKIDPAIALDLKQNLVICQSGVEVPFDYLSLDLGSTPKTIAVAGAEQYTVPAKPVPQFLAAWDKLKQEASANPTQALSLIIVGGGAGGVELALNMQACLQTILNQPDQSLKIHLIHRGDRLLSGHNNWVSDRLTKIIHHRNIHLHLEETVEEVFPTEVKCESGLTITGEHIFWVTQAAPADWIAQSDLKTDERGFVLVTDSLQSSSHPQVFATGDIATMINHQRPKAGVFAVRQGEPLFDNWQKIIQNQPLKNYLPQDKYLALIGTGDHRAIASWSNFGWQSRLLWQLKDYIDQKFMNQFNCL